MQSPFADLAVCASLFVLLSPVSAVALDLADIAGRERREVQEGVDCCVTGVVTFASQWLANSGIVVPPDAVNGPGVWFSGELSAEKIASLEGVDDLRAGMIVEITGKTSHLGFAPGILAGRLRVVGETDLPQPPLCRLRDFDWGVRDNRRASVEGVLMDVSTVVEVEGAKPFVRLHLLSSDGAFLAHVWGDDEKWRGFVDARLRLSGVAMSVFNVRGEFIGVQMEIIDEAGITVIEPAPDPSRLALTPLDALLPFSTIPPDSHRRRVRGVVTLVLDGKTVCLQSDESTLWVKADVSGLSQGDEVEAVGFPVVRDGEGSLAFACVRKLGRRELPVPEKAGWTELDGYPVREDGSFVNCDGRRVYMDGVVESAVFREGEGVLALDVEGVHVDAVVRRPVPEAIVESAARHPRIRVSGVLSLVRETGLPTGRMPAILERKIYVSAADDIELADAAALSRLRMEKATRFALFAIMAVFVVIVLLCFAKYLRYRTACRRQAILIAERKRMAGDLHDTVEQSLVAAKMLLRTSVTLSPDTPDEVKDAVATVQEILMSAKADIRETVFNLRNDELFGRSPEEVLKSMAKRINGHGIAKARTSLRGLPRSLPGSRLGDILFIINEAVTNAVKHGKAKNIIIVSDPSEGGFVLRILNDGAKFDPSAALGPESGHFGISGMRERSRRSGMSFSIAEERGMMSVRLEVRK